MLTYLINVTGDMFTAALVIGVIFSFTERFKAELCRNILRVSLLLGIIAAGIRSFITNTRRLVGGWKVGMYGYAATVILFVLLIAGYILYVLTVRKGKAVNGRTLYIPEIILSSVTGLIVIAYLYNALPNVFVYPFKFDTGGNGFLSSDYLLRLGGYILGIIVCVTAGISAYKLLGVAVKKGFCKIADCYFLIFNILYTFYSFAKLMLVLIPRKIISSTVLFDFAAQSNNKAHYYTYAAFLLLAGLAVMIWVGSYNSKEEYSTNAQHRKQKAVWRTGKRYSVVMTICCICSVLCATLFVELNKEVIREAPVEEPEIIKDASGNDLTLRVPLERVTDGHLHRFGYQTDESLVRFIVVLKQENTNNYGIGLDACEICGEAGYYENSDDQVVCKKCGVVMNKTTIGMKGGCNPIIIDYDMDEDAITVPVAEMEKNKDKFRN